MLWWTHSLLRFLVLFAGLATVAWAAWGAARKLPYEKPMRSLAAAYAGLLDLQIVVGLFLMVSARFSLPGLIGHIFLGIFAAVVAHVPTSVMKRREPEERTHLPHVVATLVSLALVVLAVMALGRPIAGVSR